MQATVAHPKAWCWQLLSLQGFEGMGRQTGLGHTIDDLHVAATDVGRTGLFRKMLASLVTAWRFAWGFEAWLT
jgi:hypothetical protein